MTTKPSAADTLIALLGHTDGDTLLALLDAQNLLVLLMHAGRSQADLERALRVERRAPGELLLELFREGRTAPELLSVLGPEAIARVKREGEANRAKASATSGAKGAIAGPPLAESRLWLVLVMLAGVGPALFALLDVGIALRLLVLGPAPVLAGVAALGALGGAIGAKPPAGRALGALGGALTAAGAFAAIDLYMVHGPGASRAHVLRLEVIVAAAAGGLPGMLVYFLGRKARAKG